MDSGDFIDAILSHASQHSPYDPVKAREYYLRTRKLKGGGTYGDQVKAHEYETHQKTNAQNQLNSDLKKTPKKLSKVRRIGVAEQKLIRARSLAMRIKDPVLKADMLAKVSAAEKKLRKVKGTIDLINPPKTTHPRVKQAHARLHAAKKQAHKIKNPKKKAAALQKLGPMENKIKAMQRDKRFNV